MSGAPKHHRDEQWVCSDWAYEALLQQGYMTHIIVKRRGVTWRLMVLP